MAKTVASKNDDQSKLNQVLADVEKQFGKQIIEVIEKTVKRLGVDNIYINVQDMGALNCTIEARCEAAIRRACENEEYAWEVK